MSIDIARIGGRIGAEISGVDGRRSRILEGDEATHYTPRVQ